MKWLFRILFSLVIIILVFMNFSLSGGVKGLGDDESPFQPQVGVFPPVLNLSSETRIGNP